MSEPDRATAAILAAQIDRDARGADRRKPCEHFNFVATTQVFRLSDVAGGPITGFTMDVTVKCGDCGLPFRFKGLPFGSHPHEPRLSADSETLRAPIEPAYTTEILGRPVVSGSA